MMYTERVHASDYGLANYDAVKRVVTGTDAVHDSNQRRARIVRAEGLESRPPPNCWLLRSLTRPLMTSSKLRVSTEQGE